MFWINSAAAVHPMTYKDICQCTQVGSLLVCLHSLRLSAPSSGQEKETTKRRFSPKIATPHLVLPHLYETVPLYLLLHTAPSRKIPTVRERVSQGHETATCWRSACSYGLCAVTEIEPLQWPLNIPADINKTEQVSLCNRHLHFYQLLLAWHPAASAPDTCGWVF